MVAFEQYAEERETHTHRHRPYLRVVKENHAHVGMEEKLLIL